MRRALTTERLARACARRPWLTVAVWLAALAVGAAVYAALSGTFKAEDDFVNTPESKRAELLAKQHMTNADSDTEVVVVRSAKLRVDDRAFKRLVEDTASRIRALGHEQVASVTTYYEADARSRSLLVSKDRHTTIVPVQLAGTFRDATKHIGGVWNIVHAADAKDGFTVVVTGGGTWQKEASAVGASDLKRGEIIGIPAALVILLIVFGAVVAALLPLLLAVFAIAIGAAITALIGQAFTISVFALNIITMMGLAVGIDYALFIISRYREERAAGLEKAAAIGAAAATASRAVFFSGMTVVLALLGMLIVPFTIFPSLGVGAISAVIVTVAAALTLLPAVLSLLGDRVDSWRVPRLGRRLLKSRDPGRGWWGRAARAIMRQPAVSLALGAALLCAMAAPAFFMQRGATGIAGLPDRLGTKRGLVILEKQFSAGWTSPVSVVVQGPLLDPRTIAGLKALQAQITADGRFTPTGFKTSLDGRLAVVELIQNASSTSDTALQNVRDLRATLVPKALGDAPVKVYVGGTSATFVDAFDMIDVYMPLVIALVLALSFALLLVAFRSVPVALTAILMNLLSVGASYGALTLVFQEGIGARLLGFTRVERIESWVPLLMFCVLFGLSMDYQVFLLSRIRERWDQTGDSRDAVAFGIQSTAGIITGAALIMVAVFAGMASGELAMFQQIGFGLAVAVLLDATVVRTVVAPATIAIIGERYWWLPRWLEWLPRLTVDGRRAAPAAAGHASAAR